VTTESEPGDQGGSSPADQGGSSPADRGGSSPADRGGSSPADRGGGSGGLATAKPPVTITFRLVNGAVRALMAIFRVRLIVEDADRLPDRPGVILASNHLSWADPVLLAIAVHEATGRRVRHMAKAEAVAVPVFGLLLKDYGGFAVRRGRPDREAFRMARDVLAGGDWLGLAPEGTRSRTGALGEPKPGVALLAMRSGADVVPAAIWGTERLWPVGRLLPRPGKTVRVRFGEPYRPTVGGNGSAGDGNRTTGDGNAAPGYAPAEAASDTAGGPDNGFRRRALGEKRAALEAATDDLMRRIAALLPEEYRGRFG
jgi:1-acyl-sn-glycerol-3-phosphate acyltransferase